MALRTRTRSGVTTSQVSQRPHVAKGRPWRHARVATILVVVAATAIAIGYGSSISGATVARSIGHKADTPLSTTGYSKVDRSKQPHSASSSADVYNGVNQDQLQQCIASGGNCLQTVPGLAACMAAGESCNDSSMGPVALTQPDTASTTLMTESQAENESGATASTPVLAESMTFAQVGNLDSELGDPQSDQSRTAWVVTVEPSTPVTAPYQLPGNNVTTTYNVYTVVIDAGTSIETGYCLGCDPLGMPSAANGALRKP